MVYFSSKTISHVLLIRKETLNAVLKKEKKKGQIQRRSEKRKKKGKFKNTFIIFLVLSSTREK